MIPEFSFDPRDTRNTLAWKVSDSHDSRQDFQLWSWCIYKKNLKVQFEWSFSLKVMIYPDGRFLTIRGQHSRLIQSWWFSPKLQFQAFVGFLLLLGGEINVLRWPFFLFRMYSWIYESREGINGRTVTGKTLSCGCFGRFRNGPNSYLFTRLHTFTSLTPSDLLSSSAERVSSSVSSLWNTAVLLPCTITHHTCLISTEHVGPWKRSASWKSLEHF